MSLMVQELPCQKGHLGLLTLNAPGSLNALSGAMVTEALDTLGRWARDERISLVVLQGAGERAFCAGGNIIELYRSLTGAGDPEAPARFFSTEYRLDYLLHGYPKPVVGIAQGAVMGGGLGLLSACRYRLVTPDVALAMPEISIGLFPDVGASWFLNRLPGRLGLFMGLTGARLNCTDAIRIGLADLVVAQDHRENLLARLQEQSWTGAPEADDIRLFQLLNQAEIADYRSLPAGHLEQHEQDIARLAAGDDLPEIVDRLLAADISSDWWQACMANLRGGCPVTAWLIWSQLKKAQQMSLKDIFRMELAMALECTRRPDLAEGIRARLVDRDKNPAWSYADLRSVPREVVNAHFQPEWDDESDPMQLTD